MGLRALIAGQFRKPRGLLGFWAERTMAKRNTPYYDRVIQLLDIRDQDRVLEIGFGSGETLRRLLAVNSACTATGIDFSNLMQRKAARRNQAAIRQGRLELVGGDVCTHDFSGKTFSKAYAINVIYFWEDLDCIFNKLYGLLSPGGRLVLFMSSAERLRQVPFAVDGVFNKYSLETVQAALAASRFSRTEKHTIMNQDMEMYCICADKA